MPGQRQADGQEPAAVRAEPAAAIGQLQAARYSVFDSPFVELETPFTVWEGVKMALLLPTVPLRLAIAVLTIILVALVNSFAIAGQDLEKPLPRWRRRLVVASSMSANAVLLRVVGFWRPRLVGAEHYYAGGRMGAIGVFNHVSYLDAFVVVWAFCAAGVTFEFTSRIPILGKGIIALQNMYVPEERDRSKQASSMVALIQARAANRDLPMLSVAPEGTLSHGRCLLSFKTGAFAAGAPVVPFLIRYKLQPHNPAWTIIIGWWHLLRLMCQFNNSLTVEVLPPYIPSAEELASPALYAANVRKLMADKLGVPMVDQDRSVFLALNNARVGVSWDGRRIVAPPGVVDTDGTMDLAPYMPGTFVRPAKQTQAKKQQ